MYACCAEFPYNRRLYILDCICIIIQNIGSFLTFDTSNVTSIQNKVHIAMCTFDETSVQS